MTRVRRFAFLRAVQTLNLEDAAKIPHELCSLLASRRDLVLQIYFFDGEWAAMIKDENWTLHGRGRSIAIATQKLWNLIEREQRAFA